MLVLAAGTARDRRPWASTAMRSHIMNSSSTSSDTTSTAAPWSRRSMMAWRISIAAPTSTPHVGCATTITFGASAISRPTMNFCRLPPDRLAATD